MAKRQQQVPKVMDVSSLLSDVDRQIEELEKKKEEIRAQQLRPMIDQRQALWSQIEQLNQTINDNWNPFRAPPPTLTDEIKNKVVNAMKPGEQYDISRLVELTGLSKPTLNVQRKNLVSAGIMREVGKRGLTKLYSR